MVSFHTLSGFALLSCAAAAALAAPQVTPRASAEALTALGTIQPGLWQIRVEGEKPVDVCVAADGEGTRSFVQPRHDVAGCSRTIVANEKAAATVQYSCPGGGWGRTTLRVETPRSIRIDTQGVAAGSPFAFVAPVKRVGDCAGGAAGGSR